MPSKSIPTLTFTIYYKVVTASTNSFTIYLNQQYCFSNTYVRVYRYPITGMCTPTIPGFRYVTFFLVKINSPLLCWSFIKIHERFLFWHKYNTWITLYMYLVLQGHGERRFTNQLKYILKANICEIHVNRNTTNCIV